MRYLFQTFVMLMTAFAFAAPISSVAAEPMSLAVVDFQRLMADSKAGKDIQAQLEIKKSAFLADISKEEQKLRDDEKALSSQRGTLSQEEFAKKAKEFESVLAESRRTAQERKKNLEEAAGKALQKLKDEIHKVVKGISEEKKYDVVLNSQNVVISNKSFDITDDALARLDKNITQIPLETAHN